MSNWKLNKLITMFKVKNNNDEIKREKIQKYINNILNLKLNEISINEVNKTHKSFTNIYKTKNPQLYLPHYKFFLSPEEENNNSQEYILNGYYINKFLEPEKEDEEELNDNPSDNYNNKAYKHLNIKLTEINENTEHLMNCFSVKGEIVDETQNIIIKDFFCKVSPLLEPLKIIADELGNPNNLEFQSLPNHIFNKTVNKINSINNASHIEGFALYLLSKLFDNNICPHFPTFNGIINCIANTYYHNITDEIEELIHKRWFIEKTNNNLIDLNYVDLTKCKDYESEEEGSSSEEEGSSSEEEGSSSEEEGSSSEEEGGRGEEEGSRGEEEGGRGEEEGGNSEAEGGNSEEEGGRDESGINTRDQEKQIKREAELLKVNRIFEISNLDKVIGPINELNNLDDVTLNIEQDLHLMVNEDNNLNTKKLDNELLDKLNIEELESDVESIDLNDFISNTDMLKDKAFFLKMKDYPVNYVFMEELENTLDDLLDEGYNMEENEWFAILFQIVYSLCCANYYFDLVHNDLHTSNIMFVETDKEYMYYYLNNQYYRIPTNGRIVKIIDFARATLTFNNQQIISDVFHPEGEAAGQYHYPGDEKYELRTDNSPNPSFDLVRLATTILERIDDELHPNLFKLLKKWCECDNGSNALYKDDSFELYIDIAHNCHNAIPKKVIKDKVFNKFKINKNQLLEDEIIYQLNK